MVTAKEESVYDSIISTYNASDVFSPMSNYFFIVQFHGFSCLEGTSSAIREHHETEMRL